MIRLTPRYLFWQSFYVRNFSALYQSMDCEGFVNNLNTVHLNIFSTVKQWKTDNNLSKSFSLKPIGNSYYRRNSGQGLRVEYFIISSDLSTIYRRDNQSKDKADLTTNSWNHLYVRSFSFISINGLLRGILYNLHTVHLNIFSTVKQWKTDNNLSKSFSLKSLWNS